MYKPMDNKLLDKSEALITIITSAFNAERTISKTINSVLHQTYKNIEYIIIDHGSTDNTFVIISEFQESDLRVRSIRLPVNTGRVGIALNIGLEQALGTYACFLDADDTMVVDFLKTMAGLMKIKNCDVAICGYETYNATTESSVAKTNLHPDLYLQNKEQYEDFFPDQLCDPKFSHYLNFWWNKMFLVSFLKKNNIRFFEDKLIYGDAWFNNEIVLKIPKLYFVDYIGICWNQYSESTRNNYPLGFYKEIIAYGKMHLELFRHFNKNGTVSEKKCLCYIQTVCFAFYLLEGSKLEIKNTLEEAYFWMNDPFIKEIVYSTGDFLFFNKQAELALRLIALKDNSLDCPLNRIERYGRSLSNEMKIKSREDWAFVIADLFDEKNYGSVGTQYLIDIL